jgi:hypothetical protein
MVADLALLPETLHRVYYISRLGMQLPIMLIFLALIFTPFLCPYPPSSVMDICVGDHLCKLLGDNTVLGTR